MRYTLRTLQLRAMEVLANGVRSGSLILFVLLLLQGSMVSAQVATTYSSNKRTLKAGILLLDSTDIGDGRGPENPDPYIFYIADSRNDIKPQNWEFINPLSPKIVSNDVYQRWLARTGGAGPQYQVGQQVTKEMACYWEVSLTDTPLQDLLQFDLLFITNHRVMRFSAADREKLRKLVDAGGILWIEDCGGMRIESGTGGGDPPGPFLLDQLQFNGGRPDSPSATGVPGPVINVPNHPVLTTPYPLSQAEIANLGDKNYANYALVNIYDASRSPNPEILVNIVGNNGRAGLPYIAAGTYGAGRIIATAGDSGCDINDNAGGVRTNSGGNSGAYSGKNFQTAHSEDLKFLYNLVAWGSANTQYRKDPRRTASSFEDIGAPLLRSFEANSVTAALIGKPSDYVDSNTAPLIAKGIIYVTGLIGTTPTVRAYSAHPSLVVGDHGVPDLSLGAGYDELWRWETVGGRPSSPVLGTIYDPSVPTILQYQDYIFVTLSNGRLVKLSALLSDNFGNISPNPFVATPNDPVGSAGNYTDIGGGSIPAPAPVINEGKVYVVQPNGMVRCVDANTMVTLWVSYSATQQQPYKPVGTPTLGYARMAITGETSTNAVRLSSGRVSNNSYAANSSGNTNDLMLYVPVVQEDPNTGIRSLRNMTYWLGTRHEVIITDDPTGIGNFRTRAGLGAPGNNRMYVAVNPGYPGSTPAGWPFIRPVVRVYTNSYNASNELVATATDNMSLGRPSARFTGQFLDKNGVIKVQDSMGNPPSRGNVSAGSTPDNAIVSVDYDVYYITDTETPPALTNDNTNAARPNPSLQIQGYLGGGEGIAMTPEDILVTALRYVNPTVSGAQPLTSIIGDYEQYQITKLRQSVAIFENLSPIIPLQIGQTAVLEVPTLRNRLKFAPPSGAGDLSGGAIHLTQYEGLTNVSPVGVPITTNDGVTYQVLRATSAINGTVTVLAALDMAKEVILSLPEAYNPAYRVQIQQLNIAAYDPSNPQSAPVLTVSLPATNNSNISITQQLAGDANRGRIVVTDLRVPGGRLSSTLSFVMTYVPAGGTTDKTVILTPTALLPNNGQGNEVDDRDNGGNRILSSGYSPILWYYILPGVPTSSPSLSGGVIYMGIGLNGGNNAIVAVDASPALNDPGVRIGFGQQIESIVSQIDGVTQKINHVRWVKAVSGAISGSPIGTQNVLAVTSSGGLAAFESGITLIADSKRIIEVDAAGAALWTLEGTVDLKVVGGESPIFDPFTSGGILNAATANGQILNDKKTLSHPSVARRLSPADYLICDTGNNRIVRVDRAGRVRWQLDRVNDPFKVLGSVDPLTLNGPLDVQLYTQITPSSPLLVPSTPMGYEIHYIIADSGNNRIVEVVDYFDSNGNIRTLQGGIRGEQIIVWVSRTTQKEGRNLRYQSIQRILTQGDPRFGQDPTLYGYPVIIAAVGNSSAAGEGGGGTLADFTGGSLLSIEYYPVNTAFPLFKSNGIYANSNYIPWLIGAPEPSRNGLIDHVLNEMLTSGGAIRRVTNPTFIQQITLPNGVGGQKAAYLICDATGVYQVELVGSVWNITWSFDLNDYKILMAARLGYPLGTKVDVGFLPTSVKKLANGSYLITNSWTGSDTDVSYRLPGELKIGQILTGGKFVGEVFQITSAKLLDGFSVPQLIVSVDATGKIRREQKMGSTVNNTNLLEHPLFGDRL